MDQLKHAVNAIAPMSPADFELIYPIIRRISIKKKTNLLSQGQVCKSVYFLEKGFCRLFYVGLEGNEINCRFAAAGNFMVDFQSFLTQTPSRYYWQAMQAAEFMAFSYQDVQQLYEQSPAWNKFGRLMAEHVYQVLNERVEMLQFLSPTERYEQVLRTQPELFNQVPQHQLASYLGIQPESLSRIRKRLVKKRY